METGGWAEGENSEPFPVGTGRAVDEAFWPPPLPVGGETAGEVEETPETVELTTPEEETSTDDEFPPSVTVIWKRDKSASS